MANDTVSKRTGPVNGQLWKGIFAVLTAALIIALWTGNARLAVVESRLADIDSRLSGLEGVLLYDKVGMGER